MLRNARITIVVIVQILSNHAAYAVKVKTPENDVVEAMKDTRISLLQAAIAAEERVDGKVEDIADELTSAARKLINLAHYMCFGECSVSSIH